MQLYSRTVALAGPPAEIIGYASEIRGYVSDKLDTDVALWGTMFGAPAGTMTYAARVEGLAGVTAMGATLMADEEYHALLARGSEYSVAPPQDQLLQPLHGELGGDAPPVGSVASVTTAIAAGSYIDVVGWGVEMAQMVESIVGTPVIFGAGQAGPLGQFAWIGVSADAAAADAANEALLADGDYITKISSGTDLFLAGAASRVISARLA